MSNLRREALRAFKQLHRARQHVFRGDLVALSEGRKQINENFRKNRNVTDENEIQNMIKLAHDVTNELRTSVIQAVRAGEGVYQLRITEETTRLDNTPYNDAAFEEYLRETAGMGKKRKSTGSCQQQAATDCSTASAPK